MAKVSIPSLLEELTGGERRADVDGTTLAEILAGLDAIYPGIGARIHDGRKISSNLALAVDGKIATGGLATPVGPESEVSILPAFGGG